MQYYKLIEVVNTNMADRPVLIEKYVQEGQACTLKLESNIPGNRTTSVNVTAPDGLKRIGNVPESELNWIAAAAGSEAKIEKRIPPTPQSPTWKVILKITSLSPIPGGQLQTGEESASQPGAQPSIQTAGLATSYDIVALVQSQAAILSELKSMNGKLTWFVILTILSLLGAFISLLR